MGRKTKFTRDLKRDWRKWSPTERRCAVLLVAMLAFSPAVPLLA